jgi:hypothetical protein
MLRDERQDHGGTAVQKNSMGFDRDTEGRRFERVR